MSAQTSPKPATGKAATQERILIAATALFIDRSYDGTTVADVAERAGVSRATVFWHFSDKGGLFREAFSRLLQPYRESLENDLSDIDPAKRLQEHLAIHDRFAREHHTEIAAFIRWVVDSPQFRETVLTPLLDLNRRFAGSLAQTISDLVPPGYDPKLLAEGLMLAFDANLILSVFDPSTRQAEERSAAIDALVALIPRQGQR